MRKHMLGNITALLAIVLVAGAQTPGSEATRAALEKVSVVRGEAGVNIEMTTRGAITPKVETLSSPDRLVIDLPNTTMATSTARIQVGSAGVADVRVGTDAKAVTRVVVDLERPSKYELVPGPGQKLTLKVLGGTQTATAAPKAIAPAAAPVSAPSAPAPQIAKASAQDFVLVTPSYAPKKDATEEPAARAQEAASKFVERPEGNLLPAASASMQAQATPAATPATTPSTIEPAVNLAAEQKTKPHTASSGPKYTGEPISVNLKDVDLKDFFRLIHEISGLNVVLDPDIHGTLTIVLDDVPWDQALDIVLKNNQLSRQLDGNVLRIASVDTLRKEAEARRAQIEAEALAVDPITVTRFLSYAHSKDVVNTLKKFLSSRGHIESDERTNALIISDIPAVMPPIDRLIAQLDRKTQEVEIEARVVAATRSFARDIGMQLGFGFGNSAAGVGGVPGTGGTGTGVSPVSVFNTPGAMYPIIGTSAPTSGQGVQIPLFSNLAAVGPTSGLSFVTASNSVRLDAILTMAESRGLVKILSRPRVVTQNNIQAVVKQGVRIPVVTAAQLNGPATTTYIEAVLRLTVTPQITVENTIFLNVDVENTTPDFGHQVNGQPTLLTQQATTQVLITDGGTAVIGGVIQTSNSVSVNQVPLLGSIPWLGNLFKRQAVSTNNQELIFFITPRIVET